MLVPRLSTTDRENIANPVAGLLVFDTNYNSFFYYNGSTWKNLASDVMSTTPDPEESLFSVVNNNGDTVFAVYNEGVRIFVEDGEAKGNKGGFAVGGFNASKQTGLEYLRVTPDSVRVYVDTSSSKGNKGGFAVGGFDATKTNIIDLMTVSGDSVRIYVDEQSGKGNKGGFAVGGFDANKGLGQDLFRITPDSVRFYINTSGSAKNGLGGFAITARGYAKSTISNYLHITADTSSVSTVLSAMKNLLLGGNIYNNDGSIYTSVITDMDGNVYTTIKIGDQTWLRENLKTTKYNDGTPIPNVTNNDIWTNLSTPAYCWYDNDSVTSKETYGALYNWYVTDSTANGGKNVCPQGFHVPTDEEWFILENYVDQTIENPEDVLWRGTDAGTKLKSVTGWATGNNATDEFDFTALPAGHRDGTTDGAFREMVSYGYWWARTENNGTTAWYRSLRYDYAKANRYYINKKYGYSIRCIKDEKSFTGQ